MLLGMGTRVLRFGPAERPRLILRFNLSSILVVYTFLFSQFTNQLRAVRPFSEYTVSVRRRGGGVEFNRHRHDIGRINAVKYLEEL